MKSASKLLLAALALPVVAFALGSAWVAGRMAEPGPDAPEALPVHEIGGPFSLADQHGRTTRLQDLRGKVLLLFFGYTHCPDVCPATLTRMRLVKQGLGGDEARFRGVFVSVDPARDTPARLREYVGFFDPALVALTGEAQHLREVARRYGAFFEVPQGGGEHYMADHSAYCYLIDPEGRVRALYPADTEWETMLQEVKGLLAEDAA